MSDDLNEVKVVNSELSSDRSTEKLLEVKKKFEQMPNTPWKDYSNPGPIENNIYIPSKYLKWEDLEFTYDKQRIKVKLNGENYTVVYFITQTYDNHKGYEYVGILKDNDIIVYSITSCWNTSYLLKQFFNNLHLEVVE